MDVIGEVEEVEFEKNIVHLFKLTLYTPTVAFKQFPKPRPTTQIKGRAYSIGTWMREQEVVVVRLPR